jgi:hypothetical protein
MERQVGISGLLLLVRLVVQHSLRNETQPALRITGNAFTDQDRMVCAGFDNGDLKMFDLRAMDTLWTTNLGHGVSLTATDSCAPLSASVSDFLLLLSNAGTGLLCGV